jgi:lipid II:glycine glycyltransferase (peptidoglycan interpeptide bridge formation enzyme)
MIAGMVIFVCNPRVALAFYLSHLQAWQNYRPMNLLYHEAICWCMRQGFEYLDFGTVTLKSQPNWGLVRFKEEAGARGFLRERVRVEL